MIKEVLLEKKLNPAQLKKRNKEAEVIKKKNPKMDKGEAFAIATKHLKEGEEEASRLTTSQTKIKCYEKMYTRINNILNSIKF
jgi:hypothetical protein